MPSHPTEKRRWKSDATDISRNRASQGQSSPKCNGFSGKMTDQRRSDSTDACILIVDDHEDNVELLRARLESWGYATDTARNGREALDKVEASPPELILLDVMM